MYIHIHIYIYIYVYTYICGDAKAVKEMQHENVLVA